MSFYLWIGRVESHIQDRFRVSREFMEKVAAACVIYIGLEERLKNKVSAQHMKHILFTSILTKLLASLYIHTLCKITNFHTMSLASVFKRLLLNT